MIGRPTIEISGQYPKFLHQAASAPGSRPFYHQPDKGKNFLPAGLASARWRLAELAGFFIKAQQNQHPHKTFQHLQLYNLIDAITIAVTAYQGLVCCVNPSHNDNKWQQESAIMRVGYARVSTQEQDTPAQISALKATGCELIVQKQASGGRWDRPELQRLLGQLRQGDVVVWKLDRLSRSLKDLLLTLERFAALLHNLFGHEDCQVPPVYKYV